MNFSPSGLDGAYVIDIEPAMDERGFFARSWCRREFEKHGLNTDIAQCSISFNKKCGTLRGMHYQGKPCEETKLVRCTYGAIYDVIVDLRPESLTFKKWVAVELSAENWRMIYIPPGFAHGFQTLVDDTEVFYQISEFYCPEASGSVRWDDPAFGIKWPPAAERVISERDRQYPDFVL
ncbi:MAG: dTDP-4-dehydrorhamnose 3,5-epimerase [Gammaproteobacteria bacterium]|nr:dTDP-4-dehydrorhamnose 3,5-epimerase [Gammaproteobacteria bacterium]